MKTINVRLVRNNNNYWVCRWRLPDGTEKQKSTGLQAISRHHREGMVFAQKLEDKLNHKNGCLGEISWLEFCEMYYEEEAIHMSQKSRDKFQTVCRHMENFEPVFFASDVTTNYISQLSLYLSKIPNGPNRITIHSYIRTLMAAIKWGYDTEKLNELPRYRVPKDVKNKMKQKKSKGRPITEGELTKMLHCCKKVRPADYMVWEDLIEGLYLSGLRLSEALILTTDRAGDFVFMDEELPYYMIWKQKSGEEQKLPASPEFANYITGREGRIFNIPTKRVDVASPIISNIGRAADIVVGRTSQGKVKYASAHDLRRSFATRLAEKLTPQDLQLMMRHKSIQTTMEYYVDFEFESLGRRVMNALRS